MVIFHSYVSLPEGISPSPLPRPVLSSTTVGFPVAATASARCCCAAGTTICVRLCDSPEKSSGSPNASSTTSAPGCSTSNPGEELNTSVRPYIYIIWTNMIKYCIYVYIFIYIYLWIIGFVHIICEGCITRIVWFIKYYTYLPGYSPVTSGSSNNVGVSENGVTISQFLEV